MGQAGYAALIWLGLMLICHVMIADPTPVKLFLADDQLAGSVFRRFAV
jgi:hypothetical protein